MDVDLDGFKRFLGRRGAEEKTIENYVMHVRHPDGHGRLRSRTLAPKSKRVVRCAWRAYSRFLRGEGELEDSEALLTEIEEIKLPAPMRERPQVPLPRPFFDALRSQFDKDDEIDDPTRAALGIMAGRGLRRIDVLLIQPKEVRSALKGGVLAFRAKGGRRLEFGVTDNYRRYLELLADSFQSSDKMVADAISGGAKPVKAAGEKVNWHLKRIAGSMPLADFGIELGDVRCHILRRTYATIFYNACGKDPAQLKAHLQWASITTAMNYVDFANAVELDAIAASMFK